MSSPIPVREADVQRAITDWLSAKRIWWMRMNTGAFSGEYKGRKRFVRFAKPGTADLLAIIPHGENRAHSVYWIEVKRPKGELSEAQIEFRREVEYHSHNYIVARSLEDVINEIGDF